MVPQGHTESALLYRKCLKKNKYAFIPYHHQEQKWQKLILKLLFVYINWLAQKKCNEMLRFRPLLYLVKCN